MPELKLRAKTLVELADKARFLRRARGRSRPDAKAAKLLTPEARGYWPSWSAARRGADVGNRDASRRGSAISPPQKGIKLGAVAQPLRAALTGSLASPGIFEVMEVLGREETLGRIADAAGRLP